MLIDPADPLVFFNTYEKEGFTWIIKALFQVLEPA
jgi:hypothetical protein